MIRNIYIHGSCPLTFVKTGIYPTDRYNSVPDQYQWFVEGIKFWQQKTDYAQPVQKKDRLSLQIWANGSDYGTSSLTLTLYTCGGDIVRSDDFTRIVTPNNIEFKGGIYDAFYFADYLYWSAIDSGRYFALLTVTTFSGGGAPGVDTFISNPINVQSKHRNTRLLRYTSSVNDYGLIVEGRNQVFERRFYADLIDKEFGLNATGFIDERQNTSELSCYPFFTYQLALGGAGDLLPDFEFDAFNSIVALNTKTIDEQPFVRFGSSQLTKITPDPIFPKYGATIQITVTDLDATRTLISGDLQLLVYGGSDIVVMFSQLGKDGIIDFYYDVPAYIADLSALEDYATLLNTVLQGQEGTFYANSDGLFYTLGVGESFTFAESKQLSNKMTIIQTTTGASQDLNMDFAFSGETGGSYYAIIEPDLSIGTSGLTGNSFVSYTSHYTPATAGTYQYDFFHDNTMNTVALSGDYLTDTGGKSPAQMGSFIITGSPRLTDYALYVSLQNSVVSLTTIIIQNNITLRNLSGYFYTPTVGSYFSLINVQAMSFTGNEMTSGDLSNLYNNIAGAVNSAAAYGIVGSGVSINTSGQTTGQMPSSFPTSGNSSYARSLLVSSYGWTITI